ncbi:ABC transporter substrate-binding protein [Promicromonospora iranensis]|uniref:Peptide/nickel transport system substrate-binding protein n=1 Tax=Promicromonospora iranensis TaxID=1105144 RepID=A0ABU2CNZ0_9MICO|nr:ABC transporter substrate-binding protein [Promicromonospora iranensis]MDR7383062.1 peptide/nickel transport system substrate-binding protein [Promicromonospora iranensis]
MQILTRRRAVGAVVALTTAALVAACSAGSGEDTGGARTDVVVGLTGEPTNLDFTTTSGSAIPQLLMNNVYEGLVTIDQEGEVQPQLAESWEVNGDRTVYTFTLHDGVTFSDGSSFTANDVVASIDRVKEDWTLSLKSKMDVVKKAEATSDTEVAVTLKHPSNAWLFDMGTSVGAMFPDDLSADLATETVGTGPYTVEEVATGEHIRLAARDDYWGEAPAIPEVTVRYFADANAQANAVRAGDIDMAYNLQTPDLLDGLEQDESLQVIDGTSNGEVLLALNNAAPPFDDLRVRRAILYAIDRKAVLDTAWAGHGELVGSMVPPTDPYYQDLTDAYPYDPDKARELLAEAGAEDLSITFDVPTRPYAEAVAQVVVSQLADVGIDATIVPAEFPAVWLDKVFTEHDYQMSVILHTEARDMLTIFGDPDYYIGYDNPRLAQAAEKADQASPDQYVAGMQEVARMIVDDAASAPLFLFPNTVVAAAGLEGVAANATTESMDLTGLRWSDG